MKSIEFMNSLNNPTGTLNPDNYEKKIHTKLHNQPHKPTK